MLSSNILLLARNRLYAKKITSCWNKANKVAKEKCSLAEKKYMVDHLDKLLNITNCCHTIFKCEDQDSGSSNAKECEKEVHINGSCPNPQKIPAMELLWLHGQRSKTGEISNMQMGLNDTKVSHIFIK